MAVEMPVFVIFRCNSKTDRAAPNRRDEVPRSMGYRNPTTKNLQRLRSLLDCPDFRLSSGGYVFKFGNEIFASSGQRNWHEVGVVVDEQITRMQKWLKEAKSSTISTSQKGFGCIPRQKTDSRPMYDLRTCL